MENTERNELWKERGGSRVQRRAEVFRHRARGMSATWGESVK